VQFGWLFDAHHLGFLVAQQKGFYDQEGVSVTLLPGGLDSSPTRSVATGAAQIGQISGPEQLISASKEGLPIVGIAAFHRSSPHALISLARKPIRKPADLRGKTVAVAYGDAAELYFRELLYRAKVDAKDVRLVPFRFDLTPLVSGQVDAITGFASDQPITLEKQGLQSVVMRYSDEGATGYGYMFIASRKALDSDEGAIRSFLRASRRGWEEVFARPEESLALVKSKSLPNLDLNVERKKLDAVRELMTNADQRLAPWTIDQAVVHAAAVRMTQFGSLTSPIATEGLTTNALLGVRQETKP
jgi:ABC-type nitrate/sulfonate/bicarbonate transport system substrate-binding protein